MAKIDRMLVGESLVGEGNEVAHIDLIIGPRGSPVETAFANARDLMYQRLNKIYRRKPVPQDVLRVELGRLYHIHILHNWKGLDVAYTPELSLTVLTDPSYRTLLADVESAAARVADIDIEFVEGALGN